MRNSVTMHQTINNKMNKSTILASYVPGEKKTVSKTNELKTINLHEELN